MTELFPPIDLALPADITAAEAQRLLEAAGWSVVGVGDWATALADPSGVWCARLVPFDPAYRLFAEDCLAGPANRWLPHVARILPLQRDGYVVLMERLWPADETMAHSFCDALGALDGRRAPPPPSGAFTALDDPDFPRLVARIEALLAEGARRYRVWGGSDIRVGNMMADAGGNLKMVDPLFIAGPKIVAALRAGDAVPLADFTRAQLEDFLTIACFRREEDRYDGAVELRQCLDRLDHT